MRKKISFIFFCFGIYLRVKKIQPTGKSLFVDISSVSPNRYLYAFLKYFHLSGYIVYIPWKSDILLNIYQKKAKFTFMPSLLNEGFVKFGRPPDGNQITITAQQLSNDYFSSFMQKRFSENEYHVPMCRFPSFYSSLDEELVLPPVKNRKRSVFMAGNIDPKFYKIITERRIFKIHNRWEVAQFLYSQSSFYKISSFSDLLEFIVGQLDEKVILIDTFENFRIDREKLPSIYNRFAFYLALSGIDMPLSHNLIEAMAAGCIPVIHKTYADLFRPALKDGVNALFYTTLEELNFSIAQAFSMPEDKIEFLRNNVLEYYNSNLAPQAVVEKIEHSNFAKIYIQAEAESLSYIKN